MLRVFFLASTLVVPITAWAQQCGGNCPPCYQSFPHVPSSHGTNSNGYVNYNVGVDSVWNNPATGQLYPQIDQGVNDAVNQWNTQNTTAWPGCFVNSPLHAGFTYVGSNTAIADIKVVQGQSSFGCAFMEYATGKLNLPASAAQETDYLVISGNVAHELGHFVGLANKGDQGSCANQATIMDGFTGVCHPVLSVVQPLDVSQANRALDNPQSCLLPSVGSTVPQPSASSCPAPTSCGAEAINTRSTIYYMDQDTCLYPNGPTSPGCPLNYSLQQTTDGQTCCGKDQSPIVIDTDGEGFDLTDPASGVRFDIENSGKPLQLSWTAAGSTNAWLVLDRDGDGLISNGTELFGNYTPQPDEPVRNGFKALAVYDTPQYGGNGDGVISAADAIFPRLRLWRDVNHNGVSEPGELSTLPEAGIISISIRYEDSRWTDAHGNVFRYRAKISTADHRDGKWAYDVLLRVNP